MEAILVFGGIFLGLFVLLVSLDAALAKKEEKAEKEDEDGYGV